MEITRAVGPSGLLPEEFGKEIREIFFAASAEALPKPGPTALVIAGTGILTGVVMVEMVFRTFVT